MNNDNVEVQSKQKDLHIAPMLDVSKCEFHHLVRILSKRAILWTEMVVDETIAFSDNLDRHLAIASPNLHPIICQIGGKSSKYCAEATRVVRRYGYQEVNLNVDCPSSRVSGKRLFGAILMADEHQSTCYDVISAMKEASECNLEDDDTMNNSTNSNNNNTNSIPISVKTRVGIETMDGKCYDDMEYISNFIQNLRKRGCKRFFIHARKCVIGGLSPAENRLVPPLNYPRFYSLCRHFPDCEFVLNGGIPGLEAARHLCYGYGNDSNGSSNCSHDRNNHMLQQQQQHIVPCKICNASNGSCTAPPNTNNDVPQNLTGCMIGRACMENPIMFWDTDRYFYGMETNPCKNRREVLDQYCLYLERTYPRRCCDLDERITIDIPAPKVTQFTTGGCHICCDIYGGTSSITKDTKKNIDTGKQGLDLGLDKDQKLNLAPKVKIASRVIDRSLKPILGIFFGRPKSKLFRRECDRLSRDKYVRNCGPGYIVRKALSAMPDELVDEQFIKTEDLQNVPTHFSPKSNP